MAIEKAFPRPKFDPSYEFIVARSFQLNGKELTPGMGLDKCLVSVRTLRQLYDNRRLRIDTERTPALTRRPRVVVSPGPPLPLGVGTLSAVQEQIPADAPPAPSTQSRLGKQKRVR